MAGADFSVRVDGHDVLEKRLAVAAAGVGDLSPLMDTIGTILETDAHDNFIGQHSPDGVPWPPSIRVLEHGGKTLQLSRRLFQSLTHRSGRDFAEVGTNVAYANRHQQGFNGAEQVASHKRTMREVFGVQLAEPIEVMVGAFTRQANTPKREFLGLSAGAREDIEAAVADHVGADQ